MEASIRQQHWQLENERASGGNRLRRRGAVYSAAANQQAQPTMRYRSVAGAIWRNPLGRPVDSPFLQNMSTAQRLNLSIGNAERNRQLQARQQEARQVRQAIEESLVQQAIEASLRDMKPAPPGNRPAPTSIRPAPIARRPLPSPRFYQQFQAAQAALQRGEPSGNMCGALALAHMTGTQPQWPQLHRLAMSDLSRHTAPGRASEAQINAARKTVYDGVYIEHLQALLKKNQVAFDTLSAIDPADIDRVFTSGRCKGVTYGYVRPGGTAHFAALRKDASGQWWDMDSYHEQPRKIASASAFLKQKCQSELQAGRALDLIYTDR
ncbi:hypothetical protein [Herbaspirillum sp. YR522]|uniref:hypothetical protein n=1 Tax=Herbaspirillum sp. YR522 TaxID=1144342 RepID=UPI00030DD8BF|nr:hypothetical protein [Herbaspirillum sp. YR522]